MNEIIELYVKLRNTSTINPIYYIISARLDDKVKQWNDGAGTKCSCGVTFQIMTSGTLINCQTSRFMLGLPQISQH